MKNIYRFIRFIIPYKWFVALSITFVVLSSVFSVTSMAMVSPFLSILFEQEVVQESEKINDRSESIDKSLNVKDKILTTFGNFISDYIQAHSKFGALVLIGILVLVTSLFKNIFLFLSKNFMIPLRTGVVIDIRNELFGKSLKLPLSYYSDERKGDIMSRMTSDVQEIESSVISSIDLIFKEPIVILIFLVTLFLLSFKLTLFVIVLLPLSGYLIGRIGKTLKKRSKKAQSKLGDLMSEIEESIGGLRIIKAFNAEDLMTERFEEGNRIYTKIISRLFRKRVLASPLSEFLSTIIMVVVLLYGGNLVLSGQSEITSSILITYLIIFSQLIPPSKSLTTAYYSILKGLASAERVDEILSAENKITDKDNAISINTFRKNIEYKDVSFKYNSEYVLKNININIEKGKTIALVGQSGSGKSTIADLLPRFYDVDEGEILIDGISVKDLKVKDLRRQIGYVNQEPILFNDTFFNNIKFGMDAVSDDEVINAAKIANAHEFIIENPDSYQANIGDRGGKLSGGQKQRISIARAILSNPPIMILDEATSALDTESERLVQEAIEKLMKSRTSIVIAHRLSTIKNADEIIVLHEGQVVERGRHDELMQNNGAYKKLHDIQMR